MGRRYARYAETTALVKFGNKFTSNFTGKTFDIQYNLDCNSNNVVYLISCKSCDKQYVGSATTKFRLRFNNHKSRMRRHAGLVPEDRHVGDLIYSYFCSQGHCGLDDMSI